VNPLHVLVSSPPTWRVTVATVCGVWIVAALIAVPTTLSSVMSKESHFLWYSTYYDRVVLFELLVSCVLPLSVIAFTYITIARHLVKSLRLSEGTKNSQMKTRRNTARIMVAITVVFLISYLPYHALWAYIICTEEPSRSVQSIKDIVRYADYKFQYMYLISTFFLLLNSCLNPVALICTSSQFRQHLKRFLTCFSKPNSPPIEMEILTVS
jgi:hypothetical protein